MLAVVFGLWGPRPLAAAPEAKPNFVIIMADDLGYADLSCYGGWIQTPNLEKLAAEGALMTDYHSNGAVCSPTRAALLTGRYQQRSGVDVVVAADASSAMHKLGLDPKVEISFAKALKQAGYATALFGKWHVGYDTRFNPIHHGFDRFIGYVSGNIDFHSHIDQEGAADWWDGLTLKDEPGYTTHLITRHAVEFIAANKARPFALYLPHEAPHYPYQGPGDAPYRTVGGKFPSHGPNTTPVKQAYTQMVQEMDKGVGEVIASLKENGIEGRTLVIFCSDNGGNRYGSNAPLRGFKANIYEGGHRVPGIACWPGRITPGRKINDTVLAMDIMPTLLALAGVAPSAERPLDGVDLSALLLENKPLAPRDLFWRHVHSLAMRRGPWKLVIPKKDGKPELYNLDSDIGEKTNLADKAPERVKEMSAALNAWRKEVGDPWRQRNG
jgi:arylsulfatase A-like enzyme